MGYIIRKEKAFPKYLSGGWLKRWAGLFLVALVFACGLAGCGKKASKLDPPPSVKNDVFPSTYPDTSTDPSP